MFGASFISLKKVRIFLLLTFISIQVNAQTNSKIDSLQTLLKNQKLTVDERVDLIFQIGSLNLFTNKENYKKNLDYLIDYTNKNNSKLGKGYVHLLKTKEKLTLDDYEEALKEVRIAKQIFKNLKKDVSYLDAFNLEAFILYQKGNTLESFKLMSIEVAKKENQKHHKQLGEIYSLMGTYQLNEVMDLKKTLEYTFLSLENFKKANNKLGIIKAYLMLAHSYYSTKNLDKSFEYANLCLDEVKKKKGVQVDLFVVTYGLISELYLEKGDFQNAYKSCNNAILLSKKSGRKEFENEMLVISLKIDHARKYYDSLEIKSKKILNSSKIIHNQINAHYHLGIAYHHQKLYQSAENSLLKSSSLIDSLSQKNYNFVFKALSETLKNQQKYKEALKYYEIYLNNEISILNKEKEDRINELQVQFDVNEKDLKFKENEVERQKNRIEIQKKESYINLMFFVFICGTLILIILGFFYFLNNKKTRLLVIEKQKVSEALLERELLLREIHHRVKNNLQIILSLLNIQASEGEKTDVEGFLMKSQSRIISMSLIHQFLYENEQLSNINFKEYFHKLFEHLKSLFIEDQKNIAVHIIGNDENLDDELRLNLTTAIPLGLILNELFINSIKHSFKKQKEGNIWIELTRIDDETFELNYHDDGILVANNKKNHNTLGLNLVQQLVKQMKGSLEEKENRKFAYTIKFKIL